MQAVTITKLPLTMSNAYLVRGARTILVDSGVAKDGPKIRRALAAAGFTVEDLALLVHTHGHSDHVGGSAQLQQGIGAARYHYFVTDQAQVHAGVPRLLALGVHTFYVGHGGPLAARDVMEWMDKVGG